MNARPEYPDFSCIRSHIERAEAERSYEVGYAVADALIAAGGLLRRFAAAMLRRPGRSPATSIW